MRIFLTGANGFVGSHMVEGLLERGHEVCALTHVRRGHAAVPGVIPVVGDVNDASSYQEVLATCDAAIHLVGIIREVRSRNVTFERLHVQATEAMVTASQKAGIGRYIQMSALGTREGAISAYHQTKWAAETVVRRSSVPWTIFRPSLIFGPRDSFVNMLADTLRKTPIMPTMGDGLYRLQPIHVKDVVRCFLDALEREDTVGQTYAICGQDRLSYREILDAISHALGKAPALKPALPLWLMQPVIRLLQGFAAFPITQDQLQMLLEENICDGFWQQVFPGEVIRFNEGIKAYLRP